MRHMKNHAFMITQALRYATEPLSTEELSRKITGGKTRHFFINPPARIALKELVDEHRVIKECKNHFRYYSLPPQPLEPENVPQKNSLSCNEFEIQSLLDSLFVALCEKAKETIKAQVNTKDAHAMDELIKENIALKQENDNLYKQIEKSTKGIMNRVFNQSSDKFEL